MTVFVPVSLEEAFDAFDQCPDAHLLAGGTDFMVEVSFAHRRPPAVICLRKVAELTGWRLEGSEVVLGAGITYTELMGDELAGPLPGLAQASRTVGSPQIRNAGTLGGNLGTASPAGDTLPVLAALDAMMTVASREGRRDLRLDDLVVGPKLTTLRPGEVIVEVRLPASLGSQEFLKVGTRNAMVIAVANVALVVDWLGHSVRCALGSVGPTVIRASDAEEFVASRIDWSGRTLTDAADVAEFAALVRSAARPIDDHRSTADYRRHAVGVCAHRALERVFSDHTEKALERAS
ncbi:MAG TPA: FAD binding domain-containing protein [Acidimicrobiales bacterium]|nr:FAD binding domain-containing protein [Acidimicrobiales bacterium]